MIDKSNVIIIGNSHGWSGKYIREAGYELVDAYKNHGLLFRILREIFFRLKLPGKTFFYNHNIKYKDKYLIVGDSLITYEFMKWLHKQCPTCKLILKYDNPVNPKYPPDGFSDEICVKWTCDKNDAQRYHLRLWEGGGYFPQWVVNKSKPVYDVFYIGKDKNRLQHLMDLGEAMREKGVIPMLYVTWPRGWQHKEDGIHKPFLPYEEVLNYIGKSKAILHLIDGAQNGITVRIQESLIHEVKLITDDMNIVDYDFYNPNNIFILGQDDMNELKHFLDSPYEKVESDFFAHAYFDQMIEEIVRQSY